MNRSVRFAALLLAVGGVTLTAQQPPAPTPAAQPPTFKVEVNYVEVDAVVTDQKGNLVRGLTKDDFQVLEDGKAQTISTFSVVDIPVERYDRPLYAKAPIEPDVKSNAQPFDGRVYIMVIDDLHTLFGRTNRVKIAAKQFVDKNFGANDLMAVLHTAGPTEANQEFTNNKRLLLAAIDRTSGRKLGSATINKANEYYNQQGIRQSTDPVNDPDDAERAFNARSTLMTLKNVSDWFANVHGRRKAILFVSEGIDYDINDLIPSGLSNHQSATDVIEDTRQVVDAAMRANVAIYGIDPRGLTNLGDEEIELGSYPDDTSLGINSTALLNEVRLSQDSLRTLSDETGGFAVVNQNQFATAYDRIVRDNSSYYVLAYYPPTEKRDGKFHKIEVRVNRPGLTVRARRGYVAPKGKAVPAKAAVTPAGGGSTEVRDALNSPLPVSGLTLHVFAAPFKGAAPNASVLLGAEMRGRDLKLTGGDKVELSYLAIDSQGKVRGGNTDSVTLNLKPETKTRVEQTGLRLLNRIDLPPGRYQIRVAAHDAGGGNIGSVLYDLDVPDFVKAPFSMSGIVLTSALGAAVPTAHPDEQLRPVLPAPPVALREFPQNDTIVLYAQAYDNQGANPHKVALTTTVTTDEGRVVFKTDEERESSELQGKRGGYGFTARVPLRDLAPGSYVLTVEGKSSLNTPAASRQVQFKVTPPIAPAASHQ